MPSRRALGIGTHALPHVQRASSTHTGLVFAARPTFRDYVRVIRRQPAFGLKAASAVAFGSAVVLREGWIVEAAIVAGVVIFAVLWFPVWRHFAPRHPRWWTLGRPENLKNGPSDWS